MMLFLLFCLVIVFLDVEGAITSVKPIQSLRILVIGGSGFVGCEFVRKAALRGHEVVAISRRGRPAEWIPMEAPRKEPKWISCDVTQQQEFFRVLSEERKFDVYVHAMGLLFDSSSSLLSLNQYASGSGSQPSDNATYDMVTRQSAFQLMDLALQQHSVGEVVDNTNPRPVMIFISAAEAAWTFRSPLAFLERYLIAKRMVEHRLFSLQDRLRPLIFRPSLIWSWNRPQGLPMMLSFLLGHILLRRGLRVDNVIDKPVLLGHIVDAMIYAAESEEEVGVKRFHQIEQMAQTMASRRLGTAVIASAKDSHRSDDF
eukprot:gene4475-4902_t